ncbi:STAS domain-containing protein [Streptomyces sp. NPDC051109]|uniref:STAS domain-containing protein n=1 Tax=Streptomyces sp. NPDC051109 TaxID=3365642 RepID=UPI00378AFD17
MESPKVTVRAEADTACVVACSGEFDQDTVGLLQAACEGETNGASPLVLDVKNVTFADSSFLNALIRLRNTRPLALEGPLPDQLHRLLDLTGTRALFDIHEDGEETG